LLPNDQEEQRRLNLHHDIFTYIMNGLYLAPIPRDVQAVLDYGTGTGQWAIDFADNNPAIVTGLDISPIQPVYVPINCKFYYDDIELAWTYPENHFDYVHGRSVVGIISDWDKHLSRTFSGLKTGGWTEIQECEVRIYAEDDPDLSKSPYIRKWQELCYKASEKIGKEFSVVSKLSRKMAEAGFKNVREEEYRVPIGPWKEEVQDKLTGALQLDHILIFVKSLTPAVFDALKQTRAREDTQEECTQEDAQMLMKEVEKEMKSGDRLYNIYRIWYGQRP
jgi:ubiquinone/menaquinone biosynthesis C-methylase UbiE